jgi:hypothetical protein
MYKILKITPLLATMLILTPTFAEYQVNMPLETNQGGRLPNGSISFGDKNNSENEQTPPSTNCIYNSGTFVQMLNSANETFQAGDKVFIYNNILIGFYSPSNGRNTPNGLSSGKQQSTEGDTTNFELCGDNLENYPAVPPVVTGPPNENPEFPTEDPSDRIPECILNTSSDYAAIETSTGKYFFNSTSFGLNNYNSPRWYYVPENYDPNNPSSYIYFDKSVQTGEPRVSGPNPNYSYAQICRVRKMEL